MSILSSLKDLFFPTWDYGARTLTPTQVWGTGGTWRSFSAAGVAVTPESVMQAAQGACIRLIADDVATLPWDVFKRVNGRPVEIQKPPWMVRPGASRWYTFPAFVSELTVSMLSDGNAFARGFPNALRPTLFNVLDPAVVEMRDGTTDFHIQAVPFPETDIMHIGWLTLPGQRRALSVIDAAEDTTGLEIAAQQYAGAFFKNGGHMGGIVEVPGGPETVDADKLLASFEARHTGRDNWWRPGVITGGAKFNTDTITPNEAALEPLWRQVLEAAARIYHVPPHMLASQQTGSQSYASVEQKSIEYVQHAIVTVTARLEAALSLLLPDGQFVKANVNALLRGDMKSRAEFYNLMLQSKVMKREEVRDKEDLPYDGDLGYLETPNNNGDEAAPQQNSLTISDVQLRDEAAAQLTEHVTDAIERKGEQHAADLGTFQADMIARSEATERKVDDALAKLEERDAAKAEAVRLASLLPKSTEVIRDEQGRISGVMERRGDQTMRRVVTRDPNGNIVRLEEVAA